VRDVGRTEYLAEVEREELARVAAASLLLSFLIRDGARCLFYAGINWDKLFESATPPGSDPAWGYARAQLRSEARRSHANRRSLRGGARGLLTAVHAA